MTHLDHRYLVNKFEETELLVKLGEVAWSVLAKITIEDPRLKPFSASRSFRIPFFRMQLDEIGEGARRWKVFSCDLQMSGDLFHNSCEHFKSSALTPGSRYVIVPDVICVRVVADFSTVG